MIYTLFIILYLDTSSEAEVGIPIKGGSSNMFVKHHIRWSDENILLWKINTIVCSNGIWLLKIN